jgi:hypothetical protein
MKSIFLPPMPFLLPLFAILIGIAWACYEIVVKNLNSKDIAFSFAALAAAFVMFYLNVCLGLEEKKKEESIKLHMTISNDCVIDVFSSLPFKSKFIIFNREALSLACIQTLDKYSDGSKVIIPENALNEDDGLADATKFFLLNCIFGYWLDDYADWQMKKKLYKGSYSASFRNSKDDKSDDTFISKDEIDRVIGNFGKGFSLSDKVRMTKGLTLPPNTTLSMSGDKVSLENPFVKFEFSIDVANSLELAYPEVRKDGKVMFHLGHEHSNLNYEANIDITITMKRERQGSIEYAKYEEWTNRLVEFFKSGFE